MQCEIPLLSIYLKEVTAETQESHVDSRVIHDRQKAGSSQLSTDN